MEFVKHNKQNHSLTHAQPETKQKVCQGFTLLELLITIAVLSILFGIGIPLLKNITATNRMASSMNALSGSIAYARSEAIKRAQNVVICASTTGTNCEASSDWSQGWMVFEDHNRDKRRNDHEPLLLSQKQSAKFIHSGYRAFGSHRYISFRHTGEPKTNGTFTFCAPNDPTQAKALIMSKTGRLRNSTTKSTGEPLECEEVA